MKKRIIAVIMAFTVLIATNSVVLGASLSEEENSTQQDMSAVNTNECVSESNNGSNSDIRITEATNIFIENKGKAEDLNDKYTKLSAFNNRDINIGSQTYIYEKPVTITVRNSYAYVFGLISDYEWNKYIFEDTVTINIEDSSFSIISGVQNYAAGYIGNGYETLDYTHFKNGLVINVNNVKFDSIVGGIVKNNAIPWPPIPKNEMKSQIDNGIQINLTDIIEGERNVILGHCFSCNEYEPSTVVEDYYVKGDSSVNLINSTITSIVASQYQPLHTSIPVEKIKEFAAISGNVSINMDDKSTVTGYLAGFPATKATRSKKPVSSRNGSTYEAHLNAKGDLTLDALGNFTHMNIANPIHVNKAWQLDTDEHIFVNFQDASKWKDGMDILTLGENADAVTSDWLKKNWGAAPGGEIDIRSDGTAKTLFIAPKIPPATVTFKIMNGKWSDNSVADKETAVSLVNGSGTLAVADVPTGMVANPGYDYGNWIVYPNTEPNAIIGDVVYTYVFQESSTSDGTQYYTLHFDTNGGSDVSPIMKAEGSAISLTQVTIKNEYCFEGWYLDEELTQEVTNMTLRRDTTVYAKWTKIEEDKISWNMDTHNAYVVGYPDGTIRPTKDIHRSEVVTMMYSLMMPESRTKFAAETSSFNDLDETMWYYTATLENAGIVSGYLDGSFRGDNSITRAEFVTILVRTYGNDVPATNVERYSDIADSWAKDYINKATEIGLVFGDTDGTFRPSHNITRAEAISILNRFLERNLVDGKSLIDGMIIWPDNMDSDIWYYYDIQEASNSHDYSRGEDNYEKWTKVHNVQILQ